MAGYTTITVHGQEIGLRFGLPAIKRISDKINLLSGAEEITINIMSMVHIIYAGYVNDCLSNDKEPIMEFKEIYNYVEDSFLTGEVEQIKKAIEVFASSKEVKIIEKAGEELEKKSLKKSIGKRSKVSV